jgi:hypothetical protein
MNSCVPVPEAGVPDAAPPEAGPPDVGPPEAGLDAAEEPVVDSGNGQPEGGAVDAADDAAGG